jgi:hypothetical protein
MPNIAEDRKDLSKQLYSYADAITGLALVQCVAFCYAILKNDLITCVAIKTITTVYASNIASTCAYLVGLVFCYRGEDKLTPAHTLSQEVLFVRTWLRYVRFVMILAAGIFAIFTMHFMKSKGLYSCGPFNH